MGIDEETPALQKVEYSELLFARLLHILWGIIRISATGHEDLLDLVSVSHPVQIM
jgi:hypothetical protein